MPDIRSKGYKGFNSGSAETGTKGWMMWSGSSVAGGQTYSGVGVELVGGSESYLRFDANQANAELDIKARKFFIGTPTTQYISGSSGNIEISSSLFHLDPANSKLVIGAGTTINASLSADELFVPASATSSAGAKAYISGSGDAGFDGDGAGNYNVDFTNGTASIAGWAISSSFLSTGNTVLSSSGNIQMGTGSALEFYSGNFGGSYDPANLAARWEIDPDDGKSLQLRIPSGSNGIAEDKIAFYVSASGEVGVNTKTPTVSFQIATTASQAVKQGPTAVVGNLTVNGGITASGNISASGTGTNIFGGNLDFSGDRTISTVGNSDSLTINPEEKLILGSAGTDVVEIGRQSGTGGAGRTEIYANTSTIAAKFQDSSITFNHPVTASGNISASGDGLFDNVGIGTTSPSEKLVVDGGSIWIKPTVDGAESKLYLSSLSDNGSKGFYISAEDVVGDNMNFVISRHAQSFNFIGSGANHGQTTRFKITGIDSGANERSQMSLYAPDGTEAFRVITDGNSWINPSGGNVGIGTTSPTVPLHVVGNTTIVGALRATTKSFVIDTPTGGSLEYGSLEGRQHDVFHRGKCNGNIIDLPKEWEWLVDENTLSVQLTSIGKHQNLYVKEIKNNKVYISAGTLKTPNCYFVIHANRKDIEQIEHDN